MGSLVLVRHATTDASRQGRNLGGASDPPLAPDGERLATAVGRALALEFAALPQGAWRAVTSSALRCRQTLDMVLAAMPAEAAIEVEPALREVDYGSWEGLTAEECAARDPELRTAWEADPYGTRCPDGEAGADVAARAFPLLDALSDWLAEDRARNALVVTHNHVIRLRLASILGLDRRDYRRALRADPGSYSIVTVGGARPIVRRINALPPAELG